MSSSDFTTHLSDYYKEQCERYYGKYYPEILDFEMRKYVDTINKRYKRRFGMSMLELNNRLLVDGVSVNISDNGYLYGNDITDTWKWNNAKYYDDKETMEYLLKNKDQKEAKMKAKYILNNTNLVLPHSRCDTKRHDFVDVSRSAKAALRKQLMEEKKINLDEKKLLGYDWL
jgi:hypothetical protein